MKAAGTLTDKEVTDNLVHRKDMDATIRYLYRTHFESINHFIRNNNGTDQDAQDFFQEVIIAFIRLVQTKRFRGESTIKTFLFALSKNMWLNELKKRTRAERREVTYERNNAADEKAIQYVLENRELQEQLQTTLSNLGDNCKKILLLYYYENYSMKEITDTMHYENEQVVRNKKYKCLKKLEDLITGNKNLVQQFKSLLHG